MVVYNSYTRKDGRVDIGKQANRHVMNYDKVRDLAVCVFIRFDVEYAYRALLTHYGEVE